MHGLIFTTFRDFLTTRYGPDIATSVFEGGPVHLMTEAYADEDFLAAVTKASETTGADASEVVHAFGVFAGEETFPRLYPSYYAVAGGAQPFLLNVEVLIHELVRATIANATPPRLVVTPHDGDGVRIHYSSPRRLCVLLRGLVEGTARHYGDSAELEESACMLRGDPACSFEVRFNPSERAA